MLVPLAAFVARVAAGCVPAAAAGVAGADAGAGGDAAARPVASARIAAYALLAGSDRLPRGGGYPVSLDAVVLPTVFPLELPNEKVAGLGSAPGDLLIGLCPTRAAAEQVAAALPALAPAVRTVALDKGIDGLCPQVLPASEARARHTFRLEARATARDGLRWMVETTHPPARRELPRDVRLSVWRGAKQIAETTLRGAVTNPHEAPLFDPELGTWSEWRYYEAIPVGGALLLLLGDDEAAADHASMECSLFAYACGGIHVVAAEVERHFGFPEKPYRCSSLKAKIRILEPGDPLPKKLALPAGNIVWNAEECRYGWDEAQ
jgi:hypothetical protein